MDPPSAVLPSSRVVENRLRCWAISRWRGPADFARFFLRSCYTHLPAGTPPMFTLKEVRMGGSGLQVTFTNPYDAYHLLGEAFWCGAEFICFTVCNILTQWDGIFPWANHMHCLLYVFPPEKDE